MSGSDAWQLEGNRSTVLMLFARESHTQGHHLLCGLRKKEDD